MVEELNPIIDAAAADKELKAVKDALANILTENSAITCGPLNAECDLAVPKGRTVGEYLVGGVKGLKGRYLIDILGNVVKEK